MKNQQLIIKLTVFLLILFQIGIIVSDSLGLLSIYDNLTSVMLIIIGIVLSAYFVIYVLIKHKANPIRTISKRRFLFSVFFVFGMFAVTNCMINKNFDVFIAIYVLLVLSLLSCIYYVRLLFSKKERISIRRIFSKIKSLTMYIINIRKADIVLLDTPIHSNIGDAAIAVAEKNYLKKVLNIDNIIEVTANNLEHMENLYSLFTNKNKLILVHGGGFLGDLWPEEEKRFRRIVKRFKKSKIVVLPQTIHYDLNNEFSKDFFEESKIIYNEHANLTIFAREDKSYKFLNANYKNVSVHKVPDIVTTLEYNDKNFKREGILFCMRADLERIVKNEEQKRIEDIIKNKFPNESVQYTDTVIDEMILPNDREEIINSKLSQFAKSKLVITDRLHGMIFAALTNTPCLAFGNSSGKVKGVYEWIKENKYIYYLDNISELDEIINKIDISKNYKYNVKEIDKYFEPLINVLKKESNYGRK